MCSAGWPRILCRRGADLVGVRGSGAGHPQTHEPEREAGQDDEQDRADEECIEDGMPASAQPLLRFAQVLEERIVTLLLVHAMNLTAPVSTALEIVREVLLGRDQP